MNGNGGIKFSSLFSDKEILCNTTETNRDSVIGSLLKKLAIEKGIGNYVEAYKQVIEREEISSTVIAPGIAMPHARSDAVDKLTIGIATSQSGVDFKCNGKPETKLVVLIFCPKKDPAAYLQAVSSISKICNNPNFLNTLCALTTPEDVWRLFDREGMELPNFICAGDIMDRHLVSLNENDALEKAIDMFVKHDLVDIPVIDANNELVGVVTALELMKVCLPDYILWMEDLRPIINFEPFTEVLRNESKTWLTEIMSMEYATISADAPAVQVAKEITRHNARVVYVIDNKKIVGKITLQDFINKVLRD